MNLHLMIDDWPFLDQFIEKVTEINELDNNKFIVYSNYEQVNNVRSKNINFAKYDSQEFWELIGDINQYNKVFFHYLSDSAIDLLNKVEIKTDIYWLFWGNDAFKYPVYKNKILLKETKQLFKPKSIRNYVGRKMLHIKTLKHQKKWKQAVNKIDYFGHYLEKDFELIKKTTNSLKLKHIDFTYGQLEKFIYPAKEIVNKNYSGKILLGNSSLPTNNHIDTLQTICESGKDYTIICPLSYPDNKDYVTKVCEYGEKTFGKKFKPILDLLPFTEYNKILEEVDFAIFNTIRSQAFGNILTLLYNNKPVILNELNPLYSYLKEMKLSVYPVSELINIDFSDQQIENKQILIENFGNEKTNKRFFTLIK